MTDHVYRQNVVNKAVAYDDAVRLDRWCLQLANLRDMGDGEALGFHIARTIRKFPDCAQSHARLFQELEDAAARLEAIDRHHGRGAALNLRHPIVIQSITVMGHRYAKEMAENAQQYESLQMS